MPVYRNITINLVSQFDILNIPEYAPPATPDDPFSPPAFADNSLVTCYVPTYPLSQFWFSYSISPPHPPKALYYFKLFINGASIVSWGCGEKDGFKGRTMYGLYDSGGRWMGMPDVAARAFTFVDDATTQRSMSNTLAQVMEIRVYRARGRKRIRPKLEDFSAVVVRSGNQLPSSQTKSSKAQSQNIKGGINMADAGLLPDDHPYRYYTYSLLDPLDMPYSTFRWYYRTWAQLEALGVTKPSRSPAITETDSQTSEQARRDPPGLSTKTTLNDQSPESKTGATCSPNSESDVSPLVIRGLSLPAMPLIDLPAPQSSFGAHVKRTISPIPALKTSTATPGRFAQLVRRSSRSPSPTKADVNARPSSPVRASRTASMSALVGAVSSAMRRHGNVSDGPRSSQQD
ncbi:hypothetical protein XANCAGTX0491_003554 [Xanthoria calcicola]